MKHNASTAYVVVNLQGPDSALLWSPEAMNRKYICRSGTKLGEWFEVDEEESILIKCAPHCETRVRNMRLEVKTPLTFFNDAKFRDVVGYAPGFGSVGCFIPMILEKERMYSAWITYVEFYDSREFQVILNLFDVKWIVVEQKLELISRTDLHHFSCNCRFKGLKVVKGFVVRSSGKHGEIFNDDYQVCLFTLNDDDKELRIGEFVKFIPAKNFVLKNVAVNVYGIGDQKGITLLSLEPTLRLRVTNWNFSGSDSRMVDVPGLCTRISNENNDNETAFDNSKPLVIEYNHGYKNFFVPKMPPNAYLKKPVKSSCYEKPVIITKGNPKHFNAGSPLAGQYNSRKSNVVAVMSETSLLTSAKSMSQVHEVNMSTLCSKFRNFNV